MNRTEVLLMASFFICFVLSLIPVLNLELSFVGEIQSDRYGYFPSLFYTLTATFILLSVFGRRTIPVAVILMLTIAWFSFHTFRDNKKWQKASEISGNFYRSLKEKAGGKKVIYLVNVPDTYMGAYVARRGIREALDVLGICHDCEIHVLSYAAIKNEQSSISCYREGSCIIIRNTGGTVKFMPDPDADLIPGFYYSARSEGMMRICLTGALPQGAAVIMVKPDGSIYEETTGAEKN
jgi:hypothetical protein